MDTLADNRIFLILAFMLFFSACQNKSVTIMESFIGMKLKDKISFDSKSEQWNDFNGNGHKVLIYNIKEGHLKSIAKESRERGFLNYDTNEENNHFSKSTLSPFIENSIGLYKTKEVKNEIHTVLIDMTNGKIFYLLTIW
jgi:hypothetical protein